MILLLLDTIIIIYYNNINFLTIEKKYIHFNF